MSINWIIVRAILHDEDLSCFDKGEVLFNEIFCIDKKWVNCHAVESCGRPIEILQTSEIFLTGEGMEMKEILFNEKVLTEAIERLSLLGIGKAEGVILDEINSINLKILSKND